MPKYYYLILVISCLLSCKSQKKEGNPLTYVLASKKLAIKNVMDSLPPHELQIKYTQIIRTNNTLTFKDYSFQVDSSNYFYPASTVKLPIAVLALEKLNRIDSLDLHTRYYIEGDSLESTFKKDITAIFAISDNAAYNRLVEFLGVDNINKSLLNKGITETRISHRVGYHTDDLETKPLIIYLNDSTVSMSTPYLDTFPKELTLNKVLKGTGFVEDDSLYIEPFNFSLKNRYAITAQHNVLKRVFFPESFSKKQQFKISKEQALFLANAMQNTPKETGFSTEEYYDGYCKFFMYGDTKKDIPKHIKIYNKVGVAYGTLTDCAYIKDSKNNIEFMLTATILVNKNGVFNDDNYEYENIGIPFLAELGRELYNYELDKSQ